MRLKSYFPPKLLQIFLLFYVLELDCVQSFTIFILSMTILSFTKYKFPNICTIKITFSPKIVFILPPPNPRFHSCFACVLNLHHVAPLTIFCVIFSNVVDLQCSRSPSLILNHTTTLQW